MKIKKVGNVKQINSTRNPGRHWQLWDAGTGERTIEHFIDGVRTTVAYMRTRKTVEYRKDAGKYVTTVVWELYERRWMGRSGGQYASPEAAFKAFCSCL